MKVRGEVGLSIGYHMISTMCHVDFYCLCGRLMFGRSLGCHRVWVLLTSLRFLFWLHDNLFVDLEVSTEGFVKEALERQ